MTVLDSKTLENQIVRLVGNHDAEIIIKTAKDRSAKGRCSYFCYLQDAIKDIEAGKLDKWMEA